MISCLYQAIKAFCKKKACACSIGVIGSWGRGGKEAPARLERMACAGMALSIAALVGTAVWLLFWEE